MTQSRPTTIFIAEDNPVLLQGLNRALSANGYTVETAEDGVVCMERLSAAKTLPDLLLLDVMMPGMTGLEVVEALRKNARLAELPVVLITAASGALASGKIPRDGGVEVLVKPFRLYDLLARIEWHVGARRETQLPASGGATTRSLAS